jgi:C-terminal processing protease CtpA/Prc
MSRKIGFGLGIAAVLLGGLAVSLPARGARDEGRFEVFRTGGGRLGVRLGEVDADAVSRLKLAEERGALVKGVEDGSPAEKAGLKEDDVIVRYQGETVQSAAQLARLVRETPPGRNVSVEVSRGGSVQKIAVKTDEREAGRFRLSELRDFGDLGDVEIDVPPIPAIPPVPPIPPVPSMEGWGDEERGMLFHRTFPSLGPRKLGIEYQEVSGQLAKYFKLGEDGGLLVSNVEEDGPAAKAGVRAGDVILKLEGKAVRDSADLRRELRSAEPGKTITLTVQRDGKPLDLQLTLAGAERRKSRDTSL